MKIVSYAALLACSPIVFAASATAHRRADLQPCPARIAAAPSPDGQGTIERLLPQAEAMALLSRTQQIVGRPIDSAYINNIRAIVRRDDGAVKTVLLPYDMRADIGDRVAFQTGYLSPSPLCSYVPALAVAKLAGR